MFELPILLQTVSFIVGRRPERLLVMGHFGKLIRSSKNNLDESFMTELETSIIWSKFQDSTE